MEILETKRGKSGVQSIVVRCGEYTAYLIGWCIMKALVPKYKVITLN